MATKSKELAKVADEATLAELASAYPQEQGGRGIVLPRLGMYSQDQTEESKDAKGKKKIEVISEAGTFYLDEETEEVDEEGKKIWEKTELGTSIEAIIFFKRHQLRMYDEATEEYTSSPVYDTADEVIPLFRNKKEVDRGTPEELKAKYMFTGKDGKVKSALEDNRIVYVLYEGKPYQMNFRGSSMFSLLSYERTVLAPTVLTKMSSEAMEKGEITWNKMTFKALRKLNAEEAKQVRELQKNATQAVALSKASYAAAKNSKADKDFDALPGKVAKEGSKDF